MCTDLTVKGIQLWPLLWKTKQWPQDWKRSVFSAVSKKGNAKECSNYCIIALISHASKKCSKFSSQGSTVHELSDVQVGFRKGRGTRGQIANICWIIEKESSRKTSTSALLTMPKLLTVWIITNYGKFFKRWEYQTTWPASWEICMQVQKQQNWTWNNRLVVNQERSMSRLYLVTLLI